MSDLLVRNLPDQLRADIRKAAGLSGRSLSDEAKHLIRKGLASPADVAEPGSSAWDTLRDAMGADRLDDCEYEELTRATAALRRSGARQTPEFE